LSLNTFTQGKIWKNQDDQQAHPRGDMRERGLRQGQNASFTGKKRLKETGAGRGWRPIHDETRKKEGTFNRSGGEKGATKTEKGGDLKDTSGGARKEKKGTERGMGK